MRRDVDRGDRDQRVDEAARQRLRAEAAAGGACAGHPQRVEAGDEPDAEEEADRVRQRRPERVEQAGRDVGPERALAQPVERDVPIITHTNATMPGGRSSEGRPPSGGRTPISWPRFSKIARRESRLK